MTISYDPMVFARREIDHFDAVLAQHHTAIACRDCEEVVQQGIKAFDWIDRAEEALIRAEDDCLVDYSPEAHQQIHQWYASWLDSAKQVLASAADLARSGYEVASVAELRIGRIWAATG